MPRPEGSPRQAASGAGVGLLEPDESLLDRPAPQTPPAMAQLSGFETYEPADTTSVHAEIPLFNARVVYLGARTNTSITLAGSVKRSPTETAAAVSEGQEVYDFSSRDSLGQPILTRLVPSDFYKPELRGRPLQIVEHAGHLMWFRRKLDRDQRPEFMVMLGPGEKAAFDEWVRRKEKGRQAQEDFENETVKNL